MKLSKLAVITALCALFAAPVSMAGTDFEKAKKEAIAEIDKAKALGHEWRDSRKMVKKAEKAEKAGDHAKAMKLVNKAREQGLDAQAQARMQANAGQR